MFKLGGMGSSRVAMGSGPNGEQVTGFVVLGENVTFGFRKLYLLKAITDT
jgi:hypothetical protein